MFPSKVKKSWIEKFVPTNVQPLSLQYSGDCNQTPMKQEAENQLQSKTNLIGNPVSSSIKNYLIYISEFRYFLFPISK